MMKAVSTGLLAIAIVVGVTYGAYLCAPRVIAWAFVAALPKDEGAPRVLESTHVISPDGKWEYSWERMDNGLGLGMGWLYDEVHVHLPGVRYFGHGDREKSSIFYVESVDRNSARPTVRWIGPRHLLIQYPSGFRPGKVLRSYDDIVIDFGILSDRVDREPPNQSPEMTRGM